MTTVDKRTGEIEGDAAISERDALGMVREYHKAQRDESIARHIKEGFKRAIDDYLKRAGVAALYDGESGLEAVLQSRQSADVFDTRTLARDHPGVVLFLAEHGLLSVSTKALDAIEGCTERDVASKYRMPGPVAEALVVRKRES